MNQQKHIIEWLSVLQLTLLYVHYQVSCFKFSLSKFTCQKHASADSAYINVSAAMLLLTILFSFFLFFFFFCCCCCFFVLISSFLSSPTKWILIISCDLVIHHLKDNLKMHHYVKQY